MSLLSIDLNATRIRAVRGPQGDYPRPELLESPRHDLPLAFHLEGRNPTLGSAALRVCRRTPQHVLLNFLPRLGETAPKQLARNKLDPTRGLTLAFQHLLRCSRDATGVVLVLPVYLTPAQIEQVLNLADRAGLPVLGSIAAPVAASLSAHAEQTWFGTTVVVDADDQAMTLTTLTSADGQAQVVDARNLPHLSLRAWRERLLNAIADCYILDSRWDPRESPVAEQSLFDQLDHLLEAGLAGRLGKVSVQTANRFQNLVLQPQDPASFCAGLCRQTLVEIEQILASPAIMGGASTILVTAEAARLPGLVAGLNACMPTWTNWGPRPLRASVSTLEDFGSNLLDNSREGPGAVAVLSADALARGGHSVAAYFLRGDIASGHLQTAAPLPMPQAIEAGPARLNFQGQDYLLGRGAFVLGRQPGVDLVFDADLWPRVAGRHCEIIYEHRSHLLIDHSPEGTLVNDRQSSQATVLRPGDWIRLGPQGPLLRYLGQAAEIRTTA